MRTTIDIPNEIYREIRIRAASEGKKIRELILEGVALRMSRERAPARRFKVPVIHSKRPGTLNLTNEQIDELTAFS